MSIPEFDKRVRNRASFRKESTGGTLTGSTRGIRVDDQTTKPVQRNIISRPKAPRVSKSKVVSNDILEKWRPLNDKSRERLIQTVKSYIPSILDPLRSQARRDFIFEHIQEIIRRIDSQLKNCILPAGHIDYSRLDSQNQKLEDSLSEHVDQLTRLEKEVESEGIAYEADVAQLENLAKEVSLFETLKNQFLENETV